MKFLDRISGIFRKMGRYGTFLWACKTGIVATVAKLIGTMKDYELKEGFFHACSNGHVDIVKLFLPKIEEDKIQFVVIISKKHIDIIRLLITETNFIIDEEWIIQDILNSDNIDDVQKLLFENKRISIELGQIDKYMEISRSRKTKSLLVDYLYGLDSSLYNQNIL
uniref:Ankyrin repeat protein n=1 Tax=viral metagenome TaxID=1070528 RepID=A0A6C0JXA7_9ZZZZ